MGVAQLPSYQALCGPVNNQQQKEPTEVNCFGMVDITLSAFDYLIYAGESITVGYTSPTVTVGTGSPGLMVS
jgi:hypothetical protein